jgi:hypothetical protein
VRTAGIADGTNGGYSIYVWEAGGNTIGGLTTTARNVIVARYDQVGLFVGESDDNVIIGSYFGTDPSGAYAVGGGDYGIFLQNGEDNQVGGAGGSRNIFCHYEVGLCLSGTRRAQVRGNYFGLGSNGSTVLRLQRKGIWVVRGASENRIGGNWEAARNVYAGDFDAVEFYGTGTRGNLVQGNDFGATADSSEQRDLDVGIIIRDDAGPQTIGGTAAGAGNYFTPGVAAEAIRLLGAGADTSVVGNSFGVLRSGTLTDSGTGVEVTGVKAPITDNTFARLSYGVEVNLGGDARVYRNTFRACNIGVMVRGRATLGNLGNAFTGDDGDNTFRDTNLLNIWNGSPNDIRAEGNHFGTSLAERIDAKIWDELDVSTLGRVDYDPLAGGVAPTGRDGRTSVILTGASALPTAAGAEITFALSAPATVTVTVLNLAGRPVAVVTPGEAARPGLQRALWTGRTATGTRAPNGQYLIHVTARSADGNQSSAVATLVLR